MILTLGAVVAHVALAPVGGRVRSVRPSAAVPARRTVSRRCGVTLTYEPGSDDVTTNIKQLQINDENTMDIMIIKRV